MVTGFKSALKLCTFDYISVQVSQNYRAMFAGADFDLLVLAVCLQSLYLRLPANLVLFPPF